MGRKRPHSLFSSWCRLYVRLQLPPPLVPPARFLECVSLAKVHFLSLPFLRQAEGASVELRKKKFTKLERKGMIGARGQLLCHFELVAELCPHPSLEWQWRNVQTATQELRLEI